MKQRHSLAGEGPRSYGPVAFALVVLLAVAFSAQVRHAQLQSWKERPEKYFVDGQPLVTSMDTYFWIKQAHDYANDEYTEIDTMVGHPDGAPRLRPVPLLSLMLLATSSIFGVGLYQGGVWLGLLLAGLFIVPLALYFRRLDLAAGGVLGGLVATFSPVYFRRTSVGGVDTDLLNLFFPVLVSLCVLLACEARTRRAVHAWAAVAGLTMLVFVWWYLHEGFVPVYLLLLGLCLRVRGREWKTVAVAMGVFALAANPLFLLRGVRGFGQFAGSYVVGAGSGHSVGSLSLPGTLALIKEAQTGTVGETLAQVLTRPEPVALGLLLFAFVAATRWKRMLPLAPVLALGLLAFWSGKRFAMFLAPFVGVGYGYLVTVLADRTLGRLRRFAAHREAVLSGLALAAFLPFVPLTAIGFVPGPQLSSDTLRAILRMKQVLPPHAVVLSWWDYGYALADPGGFVTYHDGGYHGVSTYLIARALSSTSQKELYATTAYIERNGSDKIEATLESSPDPRRELDRIVADDGAIGREDVYVALLGPMVAKYNAIQYMGNWDFDTATGPSEGYQRLECSAWSGGKLRCAGVTIDTETGETNAGASLHRLVMIRNGQTVHDQLLQPTGLTLQTLADDAGVHAFYLLTERAFASNFNQMYFLARYDPSRFELVHDDFPQARVFRFLPRPRDAY